MGDYTFSKLVSNSSTNGKNMETSVQSLKFSKSPHEKGTIVIQRVDAHGLVLPLFSASLSKHSKPNVQLQQVGMDNQILTPTFIGQAIYHSMSLKVDLLINGQFISMKYRDLSGGHKFEYSPIGKLKWNERDSSSYKLVNSDGKNIAKYTPGSSGLDGLELNILIPVNNPFLDVIVLSAICTSEIDKEEDNQWEHADHIIEAVLG